MSDQAKLVLKGRIKEIKDAQVFGNFEKREMWLEEVDDQYPQTYNIEFTQGDVNTLDAFKIGQTVECHINLRGRHWSKDGREGCINSLQCWRIKKLSDAPATDPGLEYQAAEAAHHGAPDLGYNPTPSSDDLPF